MSNRLNLIEILEHYLPTLEHMNKFDFVVYEEISTRRIIIKAGCKMCGAELGGASDLHAAFSLYDTSDPSMVKEVLEHTCSGLHDMIKEHLLKYHIQSPQARTFATSNTYYTTGTSTAAYATTLGGGGFGDVIGFGGSGGSGGSRGSGSPSGRAGSGGYAKTSGISLRSLIPIKEHNSRFTEEIDKILDLDEE